MGSLKTNIEGGLPKKGGLARLANLRGGGGLARKRGGGVFEGGLIPQCTLCVFCNFVTVNSTYLRSSSWCSLAPCTKKKNEFYGGLWGRIDEELLGVNDIFEIANPTLLVSDISLIWFGKLSPKIILGWSPWSKDNCLIVGALFLPCESLIFQNELVLLAWQCLHTICPISMTVSAHNLIPIFVTSSLLASWFCWLFWISWSRRSTTFGLWETFLEILD